MCGITGIVRFNSSVNAIHRVAVEMNNALRHRGPDGEGFICVNENGKIEKCSGAETPQEIISSSYPHAPVNSISDQQDPVLVFGHRRLSIIDLSPGGHQPLCFANEELWITFNGEIYNFPELREELLALGYFFRTQTDTEVVLAAYHQWGENCTTHFNGMWAFVLFDKKKNILFGSRDRFGVKPFYYYSDKNIFTFASEQKAFLKNKYVSTSLNPLAAADYFVAGEIEYREESFFKNIIELFPGHAFVLGLDGKNFRKWQWYALPEKEDQPDLSEERFQHYIAETKNNFINAVKLRLRSDVPVGSCLSGGIDSSSIVGVIAHFIAEKEKINIGDQLKVFTAAFDEPEIDESNFAAEVVARTKAEWHKVTPAPQELITDLEKLVFCQDVPIWSTSTYAQYRTMKLAHDCGIKVVLDGQGGDELFAGYFPYYIPFWNELREKNQRMRARDEMRAFGPDVRAYRKREFLKQRFVPSLPVGQQLLIQKQYFPDLAYVDPELLSLYRKNFVKKELPSSLNETLRGEFINTRLKGYLKCEDRCSMWHSVESRTPFSDDHLLIESAFRIPGMMKIRNGFTKYILREAVHQFVPEKILARKDKMGYNTPNNKWITKLKDEFRPYFETGMEGYVRKEKLLRDYDSFFSVEGKPENGRTFKFIAFAAWRKVMGL